MENAAQQGPSNAGSGRHQSIFDRSKTWGKSLLESKRISKGALTTSLAVAEKALDGVPLPGAKAAVGALLEIIRGLEVCALEEGIMCSF